MELGRPSRGSTLGRHHAGEEAQVAGARRTCLRRTPNEDRVMRMKAAMKAWQALREGQCEPTAVTGGGELSEIVSIRIPYETQHERFHTHTAPPRPTSNPHYVAQEGCRRTGIALGKRVRGLWPRWSRSR